MNKVLFIFFCLFVFTENVFGQPVTQRSTGTTTVNDPRWMSTVNMVIPRYADTTAANLNIGIDSCGAMIYAYSTSSVWYRQCSPKKWTQITGGGSTYTSSNGITLTGSDFTWGGTLTGATTIAGNSQVINFNSVNQFNVNTSQGSNIEMYSRLPLTQDGGRMLLNTSGAFLIYDTASSGGEHNYLEIDPLWFHIRLNSQVDTLKITNLATRNGVDSSRYYVMLHDAQTGHTIRTAQSQISTAGQTLQQVLTAGSALTVGVNNITGASSGLYFTNKSFYVNAVDSVFLSNQSCPDCFVRITATGEVDISAANQISLDATDILLPSIQGLHNAADSMLVWNPTSKITGYRPIPTGGGGSTLTNIGTGISIGVDSTNNTKRVDGINSISADSTTTSNTVTFKLVNDQTSPGNNYIYSVSPGGIKQWNKSFPVTFTAPTDGQYLRITISGTDTSFTNSTISVSPGGSSHYVQLNRNSLFAGTDSLQFYTSALRVTGSYYNNGYVGLYMHPTMTQTVMVGTSSLGSFSHASGSEGYYNTGVGYFALNGNTTGYGNTAVGRYAMGNATVTGTNNTGIGAGALFSNTSGTSNTAVGDNALQANQSGNQNTAIGRTALNSNTGTGNVAIGFQSVYSNTSGGSNTGFGTNALYYNQTGSRNVAIGYVALQGASTNSFSNATAVGYAAGLANTTGSAGIFIGDSAGYNNTTGIRNIVIGTNLTASSATANYEMNVGGLLFGTGMTATGTSTAGSLGVGVGAGSISARLHLPAGTASANTASLKITEGVKTTTAEDGAIEKDDAFYVTKTNAVRMGVGGSLTTLYSTVGNVGAGEDDLQTYSIPAGTLSQDGDYIEFTMSFSVAVNSTLKVYFGATQLFSFAALATDAVYRVTGQVVRTGAATQRASFIMNGGAVQTVVGYQTPTETLSGAVTLKATGEGTSNNDITQTLTMVKFFPAN